MRILFLNDTFPGRYGTLAACFAANPENEVLFASSYCRQGFSLPGVRRVLLKNTRERGQDNGSDAFEQGWGRALKVGKLTFSSLRKLRETDFTPDMVLSSSAKGHALFFRRVFPEAFLVTYLDDSFSSSSAVDRYSDKMLLHHFMQSASLTQSQVFFCLLRRSEKVFSKFYAECH